MCNESDLEQTIKLVYKRSMCTDEYSKIFRVSEGATRYALIDPILCALGWNVNEPTQVIAEYPPRNEGENERADYALMDSEGKPFMLIEAKRLGLGNKESLKNLKRIRKYSCLIMKSKNIPVKYGLVTDGLIWKAYNLQDNHGNNQAILDIAFSNTNTAQCAKGLRILSRNYLLDGGEIKRISLPKLTRTKNDGTPDCRFK